MLDSPVHIAALKLSKIGPGQYMDGRPLMLLEWVWMLMLLRGKWVGSTPGPPIGGCKEQLPG